MAGLRELFGGCYCLHMTNTMRFRMEWAGLYVAALAVGRVELHSLVRGRNWAVVLFDEDGVEVGRWESIPTLAEAKAFAEYVAETEGLL